MGIKKLIALSTKTASKYLMKIKYEKVFKSKTTKIKYLFFPNAESDKLLVVFSAFPGKNRPATYNYIKTFKNEKCNKLYILDNYGPDIRGGSYYLGKGKDFFVEDAVSELITFIAKDISVVHKDIIATGSSKGGYAALYFAFKYGYGHVISGAPQILLGNYLVGHPSYLEYITGKNNEENVAFLNNLLFKVVETNLNPPQIHIHVGKGEHHYPKHVLPFSQFLDSKSIEYNLELKDYDKHSEIGIFYPSFAKDALKNIL